MPREKKKTTRLSVRLLKPSVRSPIDAIKDDQDKLEPISLTDSPDNRALWAGQIYGGDPNWFDFFNPEEIAKLREKKIFGAGGGAVLFVRVVDTHQENEEEPLPAEQTEAEPKYRWMAVCFGMGYHALRQDKIEPNFGTIVALNKIGQDLIRSIDTKRPEDATIQTRTQNSRKGDIFDFGIDANRIILHSITGESDDKDFATMLTGSEGLSISADVDYNSVPDKCQAIYNAYLLKDYETRAPWYGKILPVKEQTKIDQLDTQLVAVLGNRNSGHNIHMAPPDIIDFQDVAKFRYTGQAMRSNRENEAKDGFDELDIDDFLGRIKEEENLTLDLLNRTTIQASCGDNGKFRNKWSAYKCIVCEIQSEEDGVFYVLSNGEWYAVNAAFVTEVKDAIATIPQADFRLPNFDDGVHTEVKKGKTCLSEGKYNTEVASLPSGKYILCDKKNIPFKGENGPVEFCDLFSVDKHIIHVKMRGKSSNLSHHFMQAYVSADAFRNSLEFRQKIREKMRGAQPYIAEDQPDCAQYEIVLAFIQHNQRHLPFFSQIALRATYQMIRNMNYNVSILWIDRNKIATEEDSTEEENEQDTEHRRA
jgi:uncharacterized protein (TIGR04141 family)